MPLSNGKHSGPPDFHGHGGGHVDYSPQNTPTDVNMGIERVRTESSRNGRNKAQFRQIARFIVQMGKQYVGNLSNMKQPDKSKYPSVGYNRGRK